jgi:hypothetical protein
MPVPRLVVPCRRLGPLLLGLATVVDAVVALAVPVPPPVPVPVPEPVPAVAAFHVRSPLAQSPRSGRLHAPEPLQAGPAGRLEDLWGDGRVFHRLQLVQDQEIPLKRSGYALLIRPEDHADPLASLSLRIPETFDGSVIRSSLRLCRMRTPPAAARTGCAEELPVRVEQPSARELRIVPQSPLAGDGIYGLKVAMFNPSVAGRYPFRLYQGSSGEVLPPRYLGTWVIWIEPDGP